MSTTGFVNPAGRLAGAGKMRTVRRAFLKRGCYMSWLTLIWIGSALAAVAVGQRKGEGMAALVFGLLLGPLGLVIVLLSSGDRIPCPFCREAIKRGATLCRHCGRGIPASAPSAPAVGPSGEAI